jgi:hypothetical protein
VTVAGYLQAAHAELYPDEAAKYTFALHSARIGRIQSMKAAGGSASQLKLMNLSSELGKQPRFTQATGVYQQSPQDEEIMNKVSGHTRTSGRLAYDVSQLIDEIAIMTGANSVEVLPMDTVHTFRRDGCGGNEVVSVRRNEAGGIEVIKVLDDTMPEQTRVFEAGGRSTAVAPAQRQKPLLKSAQAKAAAKKFAATASSVKLPSTAAIGVVLSGTKQADSPVTSFDDAIDSWSTGDISSGLQSLAVQDQRSTARLPARVGGDNVAPPLPSRSSKTVGLTGKVCEDCHCKSANYGLKHENYKRRWCKSCGVAHGASTRLLDQATGVTTQATTATYGIAQAFARGKKLRSGSE